MVQWNPRSGERAETHEIGHGNDPGSAMSVQNEAG